jgi:hypothetical protein
MPRIWFSGPRILGGLVRPGISFNMKELYASQPAHQRLARLKARHEIIRLARENGETIDNETADLMIDVEIERQQREANEMSVWWLLPIAGGGLLGGIFAAHFLGLF